jgi:hypothetical protein
VTSTMVRRAEMLNHKVIANWVHFVRRLGLSDNLAERLALPKIPPLAFPPPDFTTTLPHESKRPKKDLPTPGIEPGPCRRC